MGQATNGALFKASLLPEGQKRWGSFSAGLILESLILAVLVVTPMLMPKKLEVVQRYWTTPISAPPVVAWKPQPVKLLKPVPVKREIARVIPKPAEVVPPKPRIYNPVFATPIAKPVRVRRTQVPDMTEVAKAYPTNPISLGSSAIPTLNKPREAVQTGGFGDPNGLPANNRTNHSPNVEHLGSYDLPNGPGYGNGTGGAKGAKGVVASTGFGNDVAVGGNGSGPHGRVQQGLFGDEQAVAPAKVRHTSDVVNSRPVEILSIPKPVYSQEAREKKIEGEVLLRVVFSSSGEVNILRIEKGLGYGLDESAEAAARQIRFRPAERDGQPVDSVAIARIKFELAD